MTQYSILFLATILCVLEKHISPVEGIGILSTYIRSSLWNFCIFTDIFVHFGLSVTESFKISVCGYRFVSLLVA